MRDLIELFSKRYPLIRAADRAIERKGLKIMFLLRLCPLLPFNGLNYCCGITNVSLQDFTLSLVGVLPFQIFVVVVGATTGTFALTNGYNFEYNRKQEIGFVFLVSLGIATSFIALVYSWKIVKKELRKVRGITSMDVTLADFDNGSDVIRDVTCTRTLFLTTSFTCRALSFSFSLHRNYSCQRKSLIVLCIHCKKLKKLPGKVEWSRPLK